MRKVFNGQIRLGATSISNIEFDLRSRDEIVQVLIGLQSLYDDNETRSAAFKILKKIIPANIKTNTGRKGMDLWKILVLSLLRSNCNWDYDHLVDMANNHIKIREMLGFSVLVDKYKFALQTVKDNIRLLTPEIVDELNILIVKASHKKLACENEDINAKCDSFVLETDVHYPTDINLLFDAIRKIIELIARLCLKIEIPGWENSKKILKDIKSKYRKAQKLQPSKSKKDEVVKKREEEIVQAHQDYIKLVKYYLDMVNDTIKCIREACGADKSFLALIPIEKFIQHAERQIDQIYRRIVLGEIIPHSEKVFSIFEEHTEWISKGKAGVSQELGLNVCIIRDKYGFILNHHVMEHEQDQDIAVSIIQETKQMFLNLKSCSFDKGFWTPENNKQLEEILDNNIMPKKGKLSEKDKEKQSSEEFINGRKEHAAVESSINALENHGMDRCLDHGLFGFKRYVSLCVLARNLQNLGSKIQKMLYKKNMQKNKDILPINNLEQQAI